MLSILTNIWVRVQKEKQNHQEIHTYEGIYTRALALLNCGSWLNSTWSLWLLCLVQKPEVSRAGSHSHAEVKQGQDGTARIIRICKGGPEPASPPLSASPPLRCLTPSEVPHPFWDPSSDDDGVLQMKLMFFIRELNAHLAQGCEKLKEEIQQAQMPPHANQWANRSVTTSTCCTDFPTPRNMAAVSLASSKRHSKCISWSLTSVEKRILGTKCWASASCLAPCVLIGMLELCRMISFPVSSMNSLKSLM